MSRTKIFISFILAITLLATQVGAILAAPLNQGPTPVKGTVERITLETDASTGMATVTVEVGLATGKTEIIRLSQENAMSLGLIALDADGKPVPNAQALGGMIEVELALVLPAPEDRHPVASALAAFFSDVAAYETIMAAHEDGVGFGVIAQALWLTSDLGGDAALFEDVLYAKVNNDYSAFSEFTEDGSIPKNWGQLRKALLTQGSVGSVIASDSNPGNGPNGPQGNPGQGSGPDQDKNKDKGNNGDNGNGHENGNGKNKDK